MIALRATLIKVYYVYFILSLKDRSVYVGFSEDLRRRLREHNEGLGKSTKAKRPYILVYYEAYKGKTQAMKREIELKKSWSKKEEVLRRLEI